MVSERGLGTRNVEQAACVQALADGGCEANASMQVRIDVFTIFPAWSRASPASLLGKARERGLLDVRVHDLRAGDRPTRTARSTTRPFGGGAGMVLMPEPIFRAVEAVDPPRPLLLLGPGGRAASTRPTARELAAGDGFSLLCGRYEGVDDRVRDHLVDGELSIGDYVLAGGEVAAMVVLEAVGRLVPGVMGNDASAAEESFSRRPARVPAVHPTGRRSGTGTCPRCCAPATTAGSPGGAGPRPSAAPGDRPDLIEARGGLTDDDDALLDELDLERPWEHASACARSAERRGLAVLAWLVAVRPVAAASALCPGVSAP